MGRGRAKAKQAKVARKLKYSSGGVDLDRLANELGVNPSSEDDDSHDEEFDGHHADDWDDDAGSGR
ncbi:MAG: DUF3073 domain-containing protein [Streptomycetales bacterium]